MSKQQIGVVGMAVMGKKQKKNIESREYPESISNPTKKNTEQVIS